MGGKQVLQLPHQKESINHANLDLIANSRTQLVDFSMGLLSTAKMKLNNHFTKVASKYGIKRSAIELKHADPIS